MHMQLANEMGMRHSVECFGKIKMNRVNSTNLIKDPRPEYAPIWVIFGTLCDADRL